MAITLSRGITLKASISRRVSRENVIGLQEVGISRDIVTYWRLWVFLTSVNTFVINRPNSCV
jgi:hypothetical protein